MQKGTPYRSLSQDLLNRAAISGQQSLFEPSRALTALNLARVKHHAAEETCPTTDEPCDMDFRERPIVFSDLEAS